MTPMETEQGRWDDIERQAQAVSDWGQTLDLPYIAISGDISDPEPVLNSEGVPFAETLFHWLDPELSYWKDRGFALRSGLVRACRTLAEPFYVDSGVAGSWRASRSAEKLDLRLACERYGIQSAIVCPCHLPFGVIGAIVWASDKAHPELEGVFRKHAKSMFILTFHLIGNYRDVMDARQPQLDQELTRREIQTLKWAAAGKTDGEIAQIVGISAPTVRFHLTNASRKLGVAGRTQAIHHATKLGYVGRI
jgi:DNA-binding CsgD family transcriptional regulator